eukprot:tig00001007_g6234.t1
MHGASFGPTPAGAWSAASSGSSGKCSAASGILLAIELSQTLVPARLVYMCKRWKPEGGCRRAAAPLALPKRPRDAGGRSEAFLGEGPGSGVDRRLAGFVGRELEASALERLVRLLDRAPGRAVERPSRPSSATSGPHGGLIARAQAGAVTWRMLRALAGRRGRRPAGGLTEREMRRERRRDNDLRILARRAAPEELLAQAEAMRRWNLARNAPVPARAFAAAGTPGAGARGAGGEGEGGLYRAITAPAHAAWAKRPRRASVSSPALAPRGAPSPMALREPRSTPARRRSASSPCPTTPS